MGEEEAPSFAGVDLFPFGVGAAASIMGEDAAPSFAGVASLEAAPSILGLGAISLLSSSVIFKRLGVIYNMIFLSC